MQSSDFGALVSPLMMGRNKKASRSGGFKGPRPLPKAKRFQPRTGALSDQTLRRRMEPPTPGALSVRR